MTRATSVRRLALVFGALGLLSAWTLPASAQTGPVKVGGEGAKEVGDLIEDPEGKLEDVVDDTTETVEGIVKETKKTVEDTVQEVEQTVEDTVQEVEDTVNDVVDDTLGQEPGTPNDPSVTGPTGRDPKDGPGSRREGGTRVKATLVEASRGRGSSETTRPILPLAKLSLSQSVATEEPEVPSAPPTPGEVLERLALPLLMTIAVVLFLLAQGRFDRRDPKLLFDIDIDGERLGFE